MGGEPTIVFGNNIAQLLNNIKNKGTEAMTKEELLTRYAAGERDFSEAELYGVDLSGADLQGINLSDARLFGANLSGANLKYANLDYASLYGVNLGD